MLNFKTNFLAKVGGTPLTLGPRRQGQELCELEASMVDTVSYRSARTAEREPVSKKFVS